MAQLRKPSVIGQMPSLEINTGAIAVRPELMPQVQKELARYNFVTMTMRDVVNIGLDTEKALLDTLDGFLARLDNTRAARLAELFSKLEKGVSEAQLDTLVSRITSLEHPGMADKVKAAFRFISSRQSASEKAHAAAEEVHTLLTLKTNTLLEMTKGLEKQLQEQVRDLVQELGELDRAKQAYRDHFSQFTVAAAVARVLADKANTYVADYRAKLNEGDVQAVADADEFERKRQMLESRAIALESTYTRLPADAQIIGQTEQAATQTLQEVAMTSNGRMTSIKMTLISLNGAFSVQQVQQTVAQNAKVDDQLAAVRRKVMKGVVTMAASAPGENRVKQAEQIAKLVADAAELRKIVDDARVNNDAAFANARGVLEGARKELLALQLVSVR